MQRTCSILRANHNSPVWIKNGKPKKVRPNAHGSQTKNRRDLEGLKVLQNSWFGPIV